MNGQASLELLLVTAIIISLLGFAFNSTMLAFKAGERAIALRSADSLLLQLEGACARAEVLGSPQELDVNTPMRVEVRVEVRGEGTKLVAVFEGEGGEELRLERKSRWCDGNFAGNGFNAKAGERIIVLPRSRGGKS